MDETVAESHDMMSTCVRYIKENNVPYELANELKNFFSTNVIQKESLSLADQNLVYRNLPLSLQVQVRNAYFSTSIPDVAFDRYSLYLLFHIDFQFSFPGTSHVIF